MRPRRLRYSNVPGSQSESPNQCISYNSHSLLILPLKFMLLFSGTPYCGPHCLPHRRVTVTQERWARCRVIPSDAPPLPKATSIAAIGQSSLDFIEIPHNEPESPASPALLLALFFFIIPSTTASVNLRSKCSGGEKKKKIGGTTGDDEERENTEKGRKKNTSGEQNNPAGPPLPLEASEVTLCFCEGACEQNGL